MLEHSRLRKIVVDALRNKTLAQDRVYSALPFPTEQGDCPCVLVYCTEVGGSTKTKHTPLFDVSATLSIEARVADDYKVAEDKLDLLCTQVLGLVLGSDEFRSAVDSVASFSIKKGWEDGGEYSLSLAIINIIVEYKEEFLQDIADQFLTAKINTDCVDPYDPNLAPDGGPDGVKEAVQVVTIEQ